MYPMVGEGEALGKFPVLANVSRPTPSIAVHNSFTINLVHRRTQQLHDQPRPSPYTTASRSTPPTNTHITSSIAVHNSFTINLVHRRTQQLHDQPRPSPYTTAHDQPCPSPYTTVHDQPRPSPYTTASRSTSSIAVHNSFTINLVHRRTQHSRSTSSIAVHNSFTITSSITIHNGFTIVLV
ncbi:hypothetical protein ACLKA6_008185 [Drosophila palustris]